MKTRLQHPEPQPGDLVGPRYWRSLDEYAGRADFQEWLQREFPQGASEIAGVNRRHFLKIMSASFAVAGLGATGCRRPEAHILPYSKQPEGTIPGNPVHFSTSLPDPRDNLPLVVETHQHRPTHIEGNPLYAPYGGALPAAATASILDLYDPDRMTGSYRGTRRMSRDRVRDLLATIPQRYAATGGQGLAILAEPASSPTRARLQRQLRAAYPRLLWAEHEAIDRGNPERAAQILFNRPLRPLYRPERARRIVALDADFLAAEPGATGLARGFAATRKVADQSQAASMSRLYAAESAFTITGGMADHRLRLATARMGAFAAHLAAAILDLPASADRELAAFLRERAGPLPEVDPAWINECAQDLADHRGAALVIPGSHLPVAVQQLAIFLNDLLGAPGGTLDYAVIPASDAADLGALAAAIRAGSVDTLVILGGNPAYNAPADLDWITLQKSVREVIRCGYHFDETSLAAGVSIATAHYLESWGDGRTLDGTCLPVQPMIEPLFDAFQESELLARLAGAETTDPHALARATFFTEIAPGAAEYTYRRFLADGLQPGSAFPTAAPRLARGAIRTALARASLALPAPTRTALELRLVADSRIGDGARNNNGWLQECPDPITKLTWDNAILISPALATALGHDPASGTFLIGGVAKKTAHFKRGAEHAPVADLTVDGVTVSGPVHIQPGLADWTVVVALGYGRRQTGRVGRGAGFDAYPLTSTAARAARSGARIELTGRTRVLANTQQHGSMEGRAIVREANVATYAEDRDWVNRMGMEAHSPPVYGSAKDLPLAEKALRNPRGGSLYETPAFGDPPPNVKVWRDPAARAQFIPEQQWGMSIDLNTCTGCNACVVACQSENNIPIVGRDQVVRGREMHWIRLDRYYTSGDPAANQVSLPADPQTAIMPVGCLHCEMAPCEQVCPVNATVHDNQGLNVMAYNRCVGTRYCANNCPYKVRRFNFFDYNRRAADQFYLGPLGEDKYRTEGGLLAAMRANPDVTVRMRGVMEKCTYCVQRIEQAKIAQRIKARDSNDIHVPDGIIRTACQASCPTQAIVFGDISDPASAVARAKANDRDYSLLGYLNTRPRTTYLARLRNPNPRMPDTAAMPLSSREYKAATGGH